MISITKEGIFRPVDILILQDRMDSFSNFSLTLSHVFSNLTTLNSSLFFKQTILSPASWHLLIPFLLSDIIFSPTILTSLPSYLLNFLLFKNLLKPFCLVRCSAIYPHNQVPLLSFEQFLNRLLNQAVCHINVQTNISHIRYEAFLVIQYTAPVTLCCIPGMRSVSMFNFVFNVNVTTWEYSFLTSGSDIYLFWTQFPLFRLKIEPFRKIHLFQVNKFPYYFGAHKLNQAQAYIFPQLFLFSLEISSLSSSVKVTALVWALSKIAVLFLSFFFF